MLGLFSIPLSLQWRQYSSAVILTPIIRFNMGLKEQLHSSLWKALPASVFNPKAGDLTIEGNVLTEKPLLSEDEAIKFAVFTDTRFNIAHLFEKLIPFLPEDFEVVGKPNGQNCFMYCLDIPSPKKNFGRNEFDQELENRKYSYSNFSDKDLKIGDIIVYSLPGIINSVRTHAGIYVGNGRAQSRWGMNSPLLEHPLDQVVPTYWNGDERYLTIERKDEQK